MGVEAAAAVESDIAALLAGKTYDQLVSLQRQIQDKLTSGEPVDVDYWEGLLKKLLVWKSKVCYHKPCWLNSYIPFRPNSKAYTRLSSVIVWSNFVSGKETRPSRLRKNYWRVSPDLLLAARNLTLRWTPLNKKKLYLPRRWRNTIVT